MASNRHYAVQDTSPSDKAAITAIGRCQDFFVSHHWSLYSSYYPHLGHDFWFRSLSCGNVPEYIAGGVVVLRAVEISSGKTVGYVSYSKVVPKPKRRQRQDEVEEGYYTKVNHVVVLPNHRRRGVGRLLFETLFARLAVESPLCASDVRLVAVEQNQGALQWYWQLGFLAVQVHVDQVGDCVHNPICYVTLQHCTGAPTLPWDRFFGQELCGERLAVLPDVYQANVGAVPQESVVVGYDASTGLHRLNNGERVDLTSCFVGGRVVFERPLHAILKEDAPGGLRREEHADVEVVPSGDSGSELTALSRRVSCVAAPASPASDLVAVSTLAPRASQGRRPTASKRVEAQRPTPRERSVASTAASRASTRTASAATTKSRATKARTPALAATARGIIDAKPESPIVDSGENVVASLTPSTASGGSGTQSSSSPVCTPQTSPQRVPLAKKRARPRSRSGSPVLPSPLAASSARRAEAGGRGGRGRPSRTAAQLSTAPECRLVRAAARTEELGRRVTRSQVAPGQRTVGLEADCRGTKRARGAGGHYAPNGVGTMDSDASAGEEASSPLVMIGGPSLLKRRARLFLN